MDDRIDALLADIEAADAAAQAHVRRGEFGDEVSGQAAERTLLERMRGALGSTVQVTMPDRDITGTACFLGRNIIVLAGVEVSVIAIKAVRGFRLTTRVHRFDAGGLERLGLGSALRRWSAAYEEVSIDVADRAGNIRGRCALVASDYVEIAGRIIPFAAINAVHARTNPFG